MVPSAEIGRTVAGVAGGVLAASAVSAMFATLFPRFAVPLAIGWLLVDSLVGALDLGLHVIAVSFGPRALAHGEAMVSGVISMVVLTAIAIGVSLWRVDRIE